MAKMKENGMDIIDRLLKDDKGTPGTQNSTRKISLLQFGGEARTAKREGHRVSSFYMHFN